MGHRSRRLPGRQLPAAVDGVERQVPRHRPRLLARRAGHARRVRLPAHRLGRPLRALRPAPRRLDQLRHRARRLHPGRPGLLQREAQRGQRRGQQRRRIAQPVVELRRRGPDRRSGRAAPARSAAAQLPGHAAAVPGRPDDRCTATSSAAPSRATTTPTARTPNSPGSTGTQADTALIEFTAVGRPAAPAASDLPPPPVLRRPAGRPGRGRAAAGHRLDRPRRAADDARGLGLRLRPVGRGVPQRQRAFAGMDARGERVVDDSFLLLFNAHDEDLDFTLPPEEFAPAWRLRDRHRRDAGPPEPIKAGDVVAVPARAWSSCRRWPAEEHGRSPSGRSVPPSRRRSRCRPPRPSRPSSAVAAPPADARARTRTAVGSRDAPAETAEAQAPHPTARSESMTRHRRQTVTAVPRVDLPAADHPDVRSARGSGRWCRTCAASASTGSTCRRCWSPSPVRTTATTSSTTAATDPARGGRAGLAGLADAAHGAGLGVLVDIVPNHVGVATPEHSRVVVGRAAPTAGSPRTPTPSTSTGTLGDGELRLPVLGDGTTNSTRCGS